MQRLFNCDKVAKYIKHAFAAGAPSLPRELTDRYISELHGKRKKEREVLHMGLGL